jgi:NADH-quinone oxidoreductase subunit J
MAVYTIAYYILAAVILIATGLAVTRKNPVYAVICLIVSFFGSAILFYLLGAPFLAAFEVIIYAGAVMVLFLFMIMVVKMEVVDEGRFHVRLWGPAVLLGTVFLLPAMMVVFRDPMSSTPLERWSVAPGAFGRVLFEQYWLAIEIISLLLLIALVGAVQIGRRKREGEDPAAGGGKRADATGGGAS